MAARKRITYTSAVPGNLLGGFSRWA